MKILTIFEFLKISCHFSVASLFTAAILRCAALIKKQMTLYVELEYYFISVLFKS